MGLHYYQCKMLRRRFCEYLHWSRGTLEDSNEQHTIIHIFAHFTTKTGISFASENIDGKFVCKNEMNFGSKFNFLQIQALI